MPNPVPYRVVSVKRHTETPALTREERRSARWESWDEVGCAGLCAIFVGSFILAMIGREAGIIDGDTAIWRFEIRGALAVQAPGTAGAEIAALGSGAVEEGSET